MIAPRAAFCDLSPMQPVATAPDPVIPNRMRPGIVAVLVLMVLAATAVTYLSAARLFETQAVSVATSQHALYLRSLNEAIKQHQHLPFVIAENPVVAAAMAGGEAERLNPMLADFAAASGLEAIYVMAPDGRVVAASNYNSPASFLGQTYGFRPYFQAAAAGAHSDYFAIGATTGRPGYFVAEPLRDGAGGIVGVVAIKLDISELQASWEERGEVVLARNEDGIVVLSSNPDWLYRSIGPLVAARRDAIVASRQFGAQPLQPLRWQMADGGRVAVEGQVFLETAGPTELVDWTVHYLTPERIIRRQTLLATGVLGGGIAVLIGVAVFLRSRRIAAALELSQFHRRELIEANGRLVEAQEELARTSKLAALGQLAASVTHELGQPISALKSHLFAAEIGDEITSPETLGNLRRLADRMEAITRQLRFFARRSGEDAAPVDLVLVLKEALALVRHDLEAADITLRYTAPSAPCITTGNALHLEQAMVNLLRNALDAARPSARREIRLSCATRGAGYVITVTDSGPGLQGQTLDTLQEPFYSTRSSGDGMGLGLAITAEILRAHGGTLTASDGTPDGAVFEMWVPGQTGGAA